MARYLNRIADRLRADGLRVSTEIVYGRPAEMILLAARRLHGDLIIIATRGPQAYERPWLGSVAQSLMQASTLPLLLIKSSSRNSA
jgi:nucleotide-binding universal stress UspA family protein